MFERRELTRVLTVHSKHLQRNIQSSLLGQIKASVEGRCGTEGYVQPKSSVILEYSLGRMSILKPGVSYKVKFQADICLPHKGQRLEVVAEFRSKIGIHAGTKPLKIMLPRDLHIGNAEFEGISENDKLEIEVLGAEIKQNDEDIFVLAKLIRRVASPSAVESGVEHAPASVEVPMLPASGEVKSVNFVPSAGAGDAGASKAPVRRKKRLQVPGTLQLNVDNPPADAGIAEGPPRAVGSE